jgi:hypothetical protein
MKQRKQNNEKRNQRAWTLITMRFDEHHCGIEAHTVFVLEVFVSIASRHEHNSLSFSPFLLCSRRQ